MDNTLVNGGPAMNATSGLAHPYSFNTKDVIVSMISLVLGFMFWQWYVPAPYAPTLGVFIFLALVNVTTYIYIRKDKAEKQIDSKNSSILCENKDSNNKSNPTLCENKNSSILWMLVSLLATCYFLVFDNTPLHFFMFVFAIVTYVIWVMNATGNSITSKLDGFIIGDLINQIFVIPFVNFTAGFRSYFSQDREQKKAGLSLIVGITVSIPLIFLVVNLLAQADSGFGDLVDSTLEKIWDLALIDYLVNFILGIPIAFYCYGFLYGNYHKRKTEIVKYESLNSKFVKLHAVPRSAVYGPLVLLNIVYIIFFIAMGSYLFSAFNGDLPSSMTYAEYARRGFFELCAVAAINLAIISLAYTIVKRVEAAYPIFLKVLTGLMSVLTALLVATAMSKMLMYISSYGLTRLRIYTLWFMVVVMFVFILLIIWHFRRYNLGKPLIIGFIVMFLALGYSNTDGLIAKYNIEAYETSKVNTLDTELLYELSDAATPYISDFADKIADPEFKKELLKIKEFHTYNSMKDESGINTEHTYDDGGWMRFNLQKYLSEKDFR